MRLRKNSIRRKEQNRPKKAKSNNGSNSKKSKETSEVESLSSDLDESASNETISTISYSNGSSTASNSTNAPLTSFGSTAGYSVLSSDSASNSNTSNHSSTVFNSGVFTQLNPTHCQSNETNAINHGYGIQNHVDSSFLNFSSVLANANQTLNNFNYLGNDDDTQDGLPPNI